MAVSVQLLGAFKYYVITFLTFLGPPTSLMIYNTVNHQKLPFSDFTHPLLWWRNTWMVPYTQWHNGMKSLMKYIPHINFTRNFEIQVINALTSLCLFWVWVWEIKKSEFSHGLSFLKWAVDPSDFMNNAHIFSWKFTQNAEIFADFIKECIFLDVWILVQFWKKNLERKEPIRKNKLQYYLLLR